jgi:hypothetical protein
MVAVVAILGGILDLITAIGGPQLAGVGIRTDVPPPPMPLGPLLVGLAIGVLSIAGGALVSAGRSGQRWGLVMVAAGVIGFVVVGPSTGFFAISVVLTFLAGVMALFTRRRTTGPRAP